jgi:hypothetical protein
VPVVLVAVLLLVHCCVLFLAVVADVAAVCTASAGVAPIADSRYSEQHSGTNKQEHMVTCISR